MEEVYSVSSGALGPTASETTHQTMSFIYLGTNQNNLSPTYNVTDQDLSVPSSAS